MIYSLTWLAVILEKERTCCVKESVCLDPELRCGAIHTVWMKVVLETEVNCEKRSFEALLFIQDVRQSEKYVCGALLSHQNTFGSLQIWTELTANAT